MPAQMFLTSVQFPSTLKCAMSKLILQFYPIKFDSINNFPFRQMKEFDKFYGCSEVQVVYCEKPMPRKSGQLSHITEITEEDDVKFESLKKKTDQIKIISDIVQLEAAPDKATGMWSLLGCLNCLGFFRVVRRDDNKCKLFTSEKQIIRELNYIRQQRLAAQLPPQTGQPRKTLVLDLDETLVHSSFDAPQIYDFKVNVLCMLTQFSLNGKKATSYVRKRFGAEYFISEMSKIYELVLFTAATKEYAEKVIDVIDAKKRIQHRLYRDSCTPLNRIYLKNLNILNRKLKNTILLDNSKNSGILQMQNLLLIESFFDNDKDRELVRLVPFLKYASTLQEVRPVFKKKICFENKEIVIRNLPSQSSTASEENNQSVSERKKGLHFKKNSEMESLVRREDDDGTLTDNKLVHGEF